MRKRITKSKRNNLDLQPIVSVNPNEINLDSCYEYSDQVYQKEYDVDLAEVFWDKMESMYNTEELAEMGFIEIPKVTKIIPDGEQAFFSAIKNGEDW